MELDFKSPKILVVTFARQEGKILEHFINHYNSEVDTILIYEDSENEVSAISYPTSLWKCSIDVIKNKNVPREWMPFLNHFTNLRNNALLLAKSKEYDILLIVDADEFLSPPVGFSSLKSYLIWFYQSNFSAARAIGFDIIGKNDLYPENVRLGYLEATIRSATRYNVMDKPCVFNVSLCEKLSFYHGAHDAIISSKCNDLTWCDIRPILTHYKFTSLQYARSRTGKYNITISDDAFNKHSELACDVDNIIKNLKSA